jgi:hypothetical protein
LENVEIFYGHLEYCTVICDILGPFGTFYVHLVHFSGFGTLCLEKSGNPGVETGTAAFSRIPAPEILFL